MNSAITIFGDVNLDPFNTVVGLTQPMIPIGLVFIDQTLYWSDWGNSVVLAYTGSNTANLVAGQLNQAGYGGDDRAANQSGLWEPMGLAVSKEAELYIADYQDGRVRKVSRSGIISTVAGQGSQIVSGDGGPATQAGLVLPRYVALGDDNSIYIAEAGDIRVVTPDGNINTYVGNSMAGQYFTPGIYANQLVVGPLGISITPSDLIMFTDLPTSALYTVQSFPGNINGNYSIPSQNGSEIYQFSSTGQHLQTLDAHTGSVKLQFQYDANGFLISVTDANQNMTKIARDANENPTSITSPFGQVTNLAVDTNGNLASVQNPNGETFSMQYGPGSLLTQFTRPSGASSTYTYDSLGRLTRDLNAVGGFYALLSTLGDQPVQISTAAGRELSASSAPGNFGALTTTHTDGAGLSDVTAILPPSTVNYTEADNVSTSSTLSADPFLGAPALFSTSTNYTVGGVSGSITETRNLTPSTTTNLFQYQQTNTVNINGNSSTMNYNGTNQTLTNTSAAGRVVSRALDQQGRLSSLQVGLLTPITFNYNAVGDLSSAVQGTRTTTFAYDNFNNLSQITNALSQSISFGHDLAGRVTSIVLPDGRQIAMSYDSDGNVASVTPPGRAAYTFLNNLVDLVSSFMEPKLGTTQTATQYSYNLDQQLTAITRPDGSQLTFNYDVLTPKLLSTNTPTGNFTYTYNSLEQVSSITSPDSQTALTYMGNKLASIGDSATGATTVLTYNTNLQPASIAITGGSAFSLSYDADQLLIGVGPMIITRDPSGLMTSALLGGLQDSYTYNSFGELTSYTAGSLYSLSLVRDNLGRITQKTETLMGTTVTYSYQYDASGRLISVTKNGGSTNTYAYDSNSNRTSAQVNGQSFSATYDAQDRIQSYGNNTYTENALGQITSETASTGATNYSYTGTGKLQLASFSNGSTEGYLYNGFDRLVAIRESGAVSRAFTYDDQGRINGMLQGSPLALTEQFGYGTSSNSPDFMISGGHTYRFIKDQVGSIRLVVDVNSLQVLEQIDYDEFGQVLNDTNPGAQPFGFAGGIESQKTGWVSFGARDYDPETGRFVSKDPILFNGGSTNLYSYSVNDPVNFIDPTGLSWSGIVPGIIGGAIGGAASGAFYGTFVNPGLGTGSGALIGGLFGATLGGMLGNNMSGGWGANASPVPPMSLPSPLPPQFHPPPGNQPPRCGG